MNFIHYFWPSLVKLNEFLFSLATPIVKVTKGKKVHSFYNLGDYDEWKELNSTSGWNIKYYKGLGTSSSKEAKEYFNSLEDKLVKYTWENTINNLETETETATESENSETSKSDDGNKRKKVKERKVKDEITLMQLLI